MRMNRRRARVAGEAADWFVANRGGLDDEQRRRFAAWLKASPLHVEEYLGVAEVVGELRKAASDPGFSPSRPAKTVLRPRWVPLAAAAAIALVAAGLVWLMSLRPTAPVEVVHVDHFATRHGEQLTRRLSDGSVLTLNTDTAVAVRYARAGRQIAVERGQVAFQVVHDATRPFQVTAGSAEIVDLGTRFDVHLQQDATVVTVVEGEVSVGLAAGIAGSGSAQPVEVAAGEMVRVEHGQLPAAASRADVRRVTAWLHRQISFENMALGDVAAEFNRYSPVPVEIDSPALRTLAVSGNFSIDDTDSFIAFLRTLDGVGVESSPTRVRVYRK
ncbi:MAG TPA: FecR domain-containing protein [Steroidobacteraceae bacterium]|nr:FecR domain-containing protein [Steroidobacteraceae bacterium]